MIRILALVATLAAVTTPAFAKEISVKLIEKDAADLRAQLADAPTRVCRDMNLPDYSAITLRAACVAATQGQTGLARSAAPGDAVASR